MYIVFYRITTVLGNKVLPCFSVMMKHVEPNNLALLRCEISLKKLLCKAKSSTVLLRLAQKIFTPL